MVKVFFIVFVMAAFQPVFGQRKANKQPVQWQSIEEVQKLYADEPRPIIIDVFTTWCVYCKAMDNATWKHPELQKYIEANFYAIKFDAESKAPVDWMGETYSYKPNYKVHMMAAKWLGGNMVYPSTTIIPPNGDPIVIPGFVKAKDLEATLHYFGDKQYLTTEWKVYEQHYIKTWK